jgi:hypothetical protein
VCCCRVAEIFLIVKPGGYLISVQNPADIDMGINFYPPIQVHIQISTCSLFTNRRIIALPDTNTIRCNP